MEQLKIDEDEKLSLSLLGKDVAIMLQALGELQHKIAAPVEQRLITEVIKAKANAAKPT